MTLRFCWCSSKGGIDRQKFQKGSEWKSIFSWKNTCPKKMYWVKNVHNIYIAVSWLTFEPIADLHWRDMLSMVVTDLNVLSALLSLFQLWWFAVSCVSLATSRSECDTYRLGGTYAVHITVKKSHMRESPGQVKNKAAYSAGFFFKEKFVFPERKEVTASYLSLLLGEGGGWYETKGVWGEFTLKKIKGSRLKNTWLRFDSSPVIRWCMACSSGL